MKDLIAKLRKGMKEQDQAEALKKIGITAEILDSTEIIEKPKTLDEALDNFEFRAEFDRRITKAVNTNTENLKSKYEMTEKKGKEGESKKDNDEAEDDPVLKTLKALQDKIDNLEKEKEQDKKKSKKAKALEILAQNNIPDAYLSKFDLEKEGDLEEQFKTVKETFEKDTETLIKKHNPDFKLPNPKKPAEGKVSPDKVEKFKKIF